MMSVARCVVLSLFMGLFSYGQADDAPTYGTLAGEAFKRMKELQQAGELPGFPPGTRVRMAARNLPTAGALVAFPVSIEVEVRVPDAPAATTFVLTKENPGGTWSLSDNVTVAPVAIRPAAKPTVNDPALREELLARMARDQAVRQELIENGAEHPSEELRAKLAALDTDNVAWLQTVVEKHGLPGPELVGRDGANAAFLLVQHADLEFQQQMLPLVKQAYEAGKLPGSSYALLVDRVRVRTGQPQVYGTQPVWRDHVLVAGEIEDPDHIDARRAEVGLPPLTEYLRKTNEHYKTAAPP